MKYSFIIIIITFFTLNLKSQNKRHNDKAAGLQGHKTVFGITVHSLIPDQLYGKMEFNYANDSIQSQINNHFF